MSDDNKQSEPFDFDFDPLNADQPQNSSGESSFDLDSPFGDDFAASGEGVSADNPYLDGESALYDSSVISDSTADSSEEEFDENGKSAPSDSEESDNTKKGKGGWFSKEKDRSAKGKKEKSIKEPKIKKEKVRKENAPADEKVPRDWGTILCIAFSVFLLVSLLMVNIASLFTAGGSMMQTLCFLGAFNIIGLAAASVPILFYKFPKERTLPNVMLGIAAVAMFSALLVAVNEFHRYSFILTP